MTSMRAAVVAAAVMVAGLVGAADALADHSPASFDGRPAKSDLVFQYTMSQAECMAIAGTIQDDLAVSGAVSTTSYFGDLTRAAGWDTVEKCAKKTSSGSDFDNAFNGVRSQGWRFEGSGGDSTANLTRSDAMTSASNFTAAKSFIDTSDEFALEFWLYTEAGIAGGDKYVLMEIGEGDSAVPPVGDNYEWACADSGTQNFDFQLTYDGGSDRFEIEYRAGLLSGDCDALSFPSSPLAANTLYHVVISATEVSGETRWELYVNDVSVTPRTRLLVDFGSWVDTNVLRLGSSPATLSSSTSGGIPDFHSFPGTIVHASMYKSALDSTAVTQAFNAGIRNSAPAPAVGQVTLDAVPEDTFGPVDLSKLIYDIDVDLFPGVDSLDYTLTVVETSSSAYVGVAVEADGVAASLLGGGVGFNTSLSIKNGNENQYGTDTATILRIAAEDSFGLQSSSPAESVMVVTPTNDAPEVPATSIDLGNTPQLTSTLITLPGSDPDCVTGGAIGTDLEASCVAFGRTKTFELFLPDTPLGKFYASSGGECTGYPGSDLSPTTFDVDGDDTVSPTICFQGCLGLEASGSTNPCPAELNDLATLGDVEFTYRVNDKANPSLTSANVTVTTTVTSVLVADVGEVEVVPEDALSAIDLVGIDFFCEDNPSSPECEPRVKTFVFQSLPPVAQGVLYKDMNGTDPVAAFEEVASRVYFQPATDYFSVESWPICNGNIGNTFSKCPDDATVIGSSGTYPFPCTGPSCDVPVPGSRDVDFTTTNLDGVVMGATEGSGCTGDDAARGCPVSFIYELVVNGTRSLPGEGMLIYVQNENDVPTLTIPQSEFSNLERNQEYLLTDANDAPIQIEDVDGATRVIDVIISVTSSSGRVFLADEDLRSSDLLEFEGSTEEVFSGSVRLGMVGTVTSINAALESLTYRNTNAGTTDTVSLRVFDTSRDAVRDESYTRNPGVVYEEVVGQIILSINEGTTPGVRFTLPTLAIYGVIAGSTLCFCGFCTLIVCAIGAAAKRGNRAAHFILRNVLCSKLVPAEGELEHEMKGAAHLTEAAVHAEHVRLEEVNWCAHFLAAICPCCIKLDVQDGDLIPDEEALTVAVTDRLADRVAAQHIPQGSREKSVKLLVPPDDIFLWERHEYIDPETGKAIPYFYNSKTGQSSWLQPRVRDESDPPPAEI